MRFIAVMLLGLMYSSQAFSQSTIPCKDSPIGAKTSHRELISNNVYGFCIIDTCKTEEGYEATPIRNRCSKGPGLSWFTTNQVIIENEVTVAVRAKLSRPASEELIVSLDSSMSTGQSPLDFELPSAVRFAKNASLSDPILIRIHRRVLFQPDRVISLRFASSLQANTNPTLELKIIDSETAAPMAFTLSAPAEVFEGDAIPLTVSITPAPARLFPTLLMVRASGDLESLVSASVRGSFRPKARR